MFKLIFNLQHVSHNVGNLKVFTCATLLEHM